MEKSMSIGTIILIILVIALLGGFSGIGGSSFYGTGYYGGGGLGLVIVVVLILVLMGRIWGLRGFVIPPWRRRWELGRMNLKVVNIKFTQLEGVMDNMGHGLLLWLTEIQRSNCP